MRNGLVKVWRVCAVKGENMRVQVKTLNSVPVKSRKWLPGKHPGGRPTKYRPEYCEKILKYFDIEAYEERTITKRYGKDCEVEEPLRWANDLPTLEKFATSIEVDVNTLLDWEHRYPEFHRTLARARNMQEHILITNGLHGTYNHNIARLVLSHRHGYKDSSGNTNIAIGLSVTGLIQDVNAECKQLGYKQ